jgi:integrase
MPSQSAKPSAQADLREVEAGRRDLDWLRHANATLLDSVGASLGTVQALLGHSSSEITRGTYMHSVPADARQAVQKVEEAIGPKWTQIPEWPEPVTLVTQ